jgi:hypothetical protein
MVKPILAAGCAGLFSGRINPQKVAVFDGDRELWAGVTISPLCEVDGRSSVLKVVLFMFYPFRNERSTRILTHADP